MLLAVLFAWVSEDVALGKRQARTRAKGHSRTGLVQFKAKGRTKQKRK
jgi:hypothetical protein